MKRENWYKEGLDTPLRKLIKEVDAKAEQNKTDIAKNTQDIAKNTQDIATNVDAISDANDNIDSLDDRVTALEEGGSGGGEVYPPVGEEIEVGTWIDGRKIYRTILSISNIAVSSRRVTLGDDASYPILANVEEIINVHGNSEYIVGNIYFYNYIPVITQFNSSTHILEASAPGWDIGGVNYKYLIIDYVKTAT